MWVSLDSNVYKRFHDVILPSRNGTSQIDHIVVCQYGLFIVETKNLKGWIFGSEGNPKWTQSLYGKKYQFQSYIKKHRNVVLSPEKVGEITSILNGHISDSGITKKDHIKSLKQRHNSPEICPKCGSAMVERKANKGSNAGSIFLGCSGFPKCRYTKSA